MSKISFSPPNTVSTPGMDEPVSTTQTTQVTQKISRSSKTPGSSPVLKSRKNSAVEAEMAPLELAPEPMLMENKERFVLFPIQHHDLWKKYKDHCAVMWFAEEIDLSKDMAHWEKLTDNERHFIKNIIGFFAGSDGIVMENLATRFTREVQWPEAKFFYAVQNQMEAIHSETYSLLIDTYIHDPKEKSELLRAIETIPCVKSKADWALNWIDSKDADFATRLLGFAAVEGDLLLRGLLRHLLAEAAWRDAWLDSVERVHCARRGASHGFRLCSLRKVGESFDEAEGAQDH